MQHGEMVFNIRATGSWLIIFFNRYWADVISFKCLAVIIILPVGFLSRIIYTSFTGFSDFSLLAQLEILVVSCVFVPIKMFASGCQGTIWRDSLPG